MSDNKKPEEIATQRMLLLSPLLEEGLDKGLFKERKEKICQETGLSERTIRRYINSYRAQGFQGLKPIQKKSGKEDAIPEEVLNEAIRLRREVTSRSVSEIIRILEWENLIDCGSVKRSTLQEKLQKRGYSSRQMAMYASKGISTRRFQKRTRNKMWHSDIKYGCYLPIGDKGKPKQVYLVTFLDDATRMVLHAEFYSSLEQIIVEDCFRKAVMKHGLPQSVYFDNGKQYRTRWMTRACAKLGVRLMFAKPYSPEGTGKIERFNQNIDRFLDEYQVDPSPKSLDNMNRLFWVWLEECYQNKEHSAINGLTPVQAYNLDSTPIKRIAPEIIADAFLHAEERKVDKSGCISFNGDKYEVGVTFVGCTVDVVYDPSDTFEVTIEYPGAKPFKAKKLTIGERVGTKPVVPEHLTILKPIESRLLNGAQRKNELRKDKERSTAISFRSITTVGGDDV